MSEQEETTNTPPSPEPPADPAEPPVDPQGAPPADPTDPPAEPKSAIDGADDDADNGPQALEGDEITAETFAEALGEDVEVDPEIQQEALELINTTTNKADLAKGIATLGTKMLEQAGAQLAEQFNTIQTERQAAITADKEFGGANQAASLKEAKRVAEKFGGKEVLRELTETGFGNSIHAVRMLNRIGAALPAEPDPVDGDPPKGERHLADRMFPN